MTSLPCALVTGATRGIGRAVVELLVARGRRVVACARDGAALAELGRAYGDRVVGIPVDLAEPGASLWAVDEAYRQVGPITQLVYAAGVVRYAPIGEIEESALRAQLEVNFVAPFAMLQRAGTMMRALGGGAMVVLASTLAFRAAANTAAYAASKAALVSAVRSFALELAPSVRENGVAPGIVDTDMVRVPRRTAGPDESVEVLIDEQLEGMRGLHPLGRLGTPADVAEAVLYLLGAPWVTGSVLTVDGGLTAS